MDFDSDFEIDPEFLQGRVSPLIESLVFHTRKHVRFFLERGVDICASYDSRFASAVHACFCSGVSPELLREFLVLGAPANGGGGDDGNGDERDIPIMIAVMGTPGALRDLLDFGADPHTKGRLMARGWGWWRGLDRLREFQDLDRESVLMRAFSSGRTGAIRALLARGAEPTGPILTLCIETLLREKQP